VSAVAGVDATVLRNDRVDENATGGITVKAARPSLLGMLRGAVAQGRFLDRASERYPTVVLGRSRPSGSASPPCAAGPRCRWAAGRSP
jgi:putative ABC transport system permease protein